VERGPQDSTPSSRGTLKPMKNSSKRNEMMVG
jgi:hypothetical protein